MTLPSKRWDYRRVVLSLAKDVPTPYPVGQTSVHATLFAKNEDSKRLVTWNPGRQASSLPFLERNP